MQRVSKKIGGKVVKGYVVNDVFYSSIKDARAAAGTVKPEQAVRSDKKCVGRDNCIAVADTLLTNEELLMAWAMDDNFGISEYNELNDYADMRRAGKSGLLTQKAAALAIDAASTATSGKVDARTNEEFKQRKYKNPAFVSDAPAEEDIYNSSCDIENEINRLLDAQHNAWLATNPDFGPEVVESTDKRVLIHKPDGTVEVFKPERAKAEPYTEYQPRWTQEELYAWSQGLGK